MKTADIFILGATLMAAPVAMAQSDAVTATDTPDYTSAESMSVSEAPRWYQQFTLSDPGYVTPEAAPEGITRRDVKIQWLKTGRWELTLDLTSRDEQSALPREEMAAGATFQITPRLSVGGDVSVGAQELDDQGSWNEQDVETGIRLRSAFRF